MSLETNQLNFSTSEILNSGSDLLINNTTGSIILNPTGNIIMNQKVLNLDDNNIINILSITNTGELTIEARGSGSIQFKAPSQQVVPSMKVENNGITYFDVIPTTTAVSDSTNEILNNNNFTTAISFNPTISGNTAGSPVLSRSGVYYRIGNLVYFKAVITVSAFTGLNTADDIRISLPLGIDYTSFAMPQSLTITQISGFTPTNTDLSISIGGTGNNIPGTIDYAKIYYRPTINSTGLTAATIGDFSVGCTIRYCGCYYDF